MGRGRGRGRGARGGRGRGRGRTSGAVVGEVTNAIEPAQPGNIDLSIVKLERDDMIEESTQPSQSNQVLDLSIVKIEDGVMQPTHPRRSRSRTQDKTPTRSSTRIRERLERSREIALPPQPPQPPRVRKPRAPRKDPVVQEPINLNLLNAIKLDPDAPPAPEYLGLQDIKMEPGTPPPEVEDEPRVPGPSRLSMDFSSFWPVKMNERIETGSRLDVEGVGRRSFGNMRKGRSHRFKGFGGVEFTEILDGGDDQQGQQQPEQSCTVLQPIGTALADQYYVVDRQRDADVFERPYGYMIKKCMQEYHTLATKTIPELTEKLNTQTAGAYQLAKALSTTKDLNNTILQENDIYREDSKKQETISKLERARAEEAWIDLDKTKIFYQTTSEAATQQHFLSRKYTDAIESIRSQCEERIKEIEIDRKKLARENEVLVTKQDNYSITKRRAKEYKAGMGVLIKVLRKRDGRAVEVVKNVLGEKVVDRALGAGEDGHVDAIWTRLFDRESDDEFEDVRGVDDPMTVGNDGIDIGGMIEVGGRGDEEEDDDNGFVDVEKVNVIPEGVAVVLEADAPMDVGVVELEAKGVEDTKSRVDEDSSPSNEELEGVEVIIEDVGFSKNVVVSPAVLDLPVASPLDPALRKSLSTMITPLSPIRSPVFTYQRVVIPQVLPPASPPRTETPQVLPQRTETPQVLPPASPPRTETPSPTTPLSPISPEKPGQLSGEASPVATQSPVTSSTEPELIEKHEWDVDENERSTPPVVLYKHGRRPRRSNVGKWNGTSHAITSTSLASKLKQDVHILPVGVGANVCEKKRLENQIAVKTEKRRAEKRSSGEEDGGKKRSKGDWSMEDLFGDEDKDERVDRGEYVFGGEGESSSDDDSLFEELHKELCRGKGVRVGVVEKDLEVSSSSDESEGGIQSPDEGVGDGRMRRVLPVIFDVDPARQSEINNLLCLPFEAQQTSMSYLATLLRQTNPINTIYLFIAQTSEADIRQPLATDLLVTKCPLIPRFLSLLAAIKTLCSSYPEFKHLWKDFLTFISEELVPDDTRREIENEKLLEQFGRFIGALCSEFEQENRSVQNLGLELLFKFCFYRGPFAYSFGFGVLCSDGAGVLGWSVALMEFGGLSAMAKAVVYCFCKSPRYGDAAKSNSVVDFLKKALLIPVPDLTFEQFFDTLVEGVRGLESRREIEKVGEVIGGCCVQLGWGWFERKFKGVFERVVKGWGGGGVSDGGFMAVVIGMGKAALGMRRGDLPLSLDNVHRMLEVVCRIDKVPDTICEVANEYIKSIKNAPLRTLEEAPVEWVYERRGPGATNNTRCFKKKKTKQRGGGANAVVVPPRQGMRSNNREPLLPTPNVVPTWSGGERGRGDWSQGQRGRGGGGGRGKRGSRGRGGGRRGRY